MPSTTDVIDCKERQSLLSESCTEEDGETREDRIEAPLLGPKPSAHRTVSAHWTLLTFLRGMIGPGCLALPVAFLQAGLWAGLALVVVLGLINLHSMTLLLKSATLLCEKSGKLELDYGHLAKKAFDYGPQSWRKHSRKPLYVTNIIISVLQLGVCSVLYVFMARHTKEVFEATPESSDIYDVKNNGMDIRYYLLIFLVPLILINFIRSIRVLSIVSIVCNVVMLLVFVVIFQHLILADHRLIIPTLPAFTSVTSMIVASGSILYAFEGQALVLPLENHINDKAAMRGPFGVLSTGMYLVTLIYAATGFFGYITFGDQVRGSITLNLPATVSYDVVKVALVMVVYGSYALQLYVVVEMLWPAIRRKVFAGLHKWHLLLEYAFRATLVVITFALAAAIPELDDIIPLVGVTAGMLLALVFPPLLEIVTFWTIWRRGRRAVFWLHLAKNCLLVAVGLLGLVSGVVLNVQKIAVKYPQ